MSRPDDWTWEHELLVVVAWLRGRAGKVPHCGHGYLLQAADAIEARVVEAAGLPPIASRDGPSGSIGAAGRVEGGGGEGG